MESLDFLNNEEQEETPEEQATFEFLRQFEGVPKIQENFSAPSGTPEQESTYDRVGKIMGVPTNIVRQDPENFKKIAEQPDIMNMVSTLPRTSEYYKNFDSAAISKHDSNNLGKIESWWRENSNSFDRNRKSLSEVEFFKDSGASLKIGEETVRGGKLGITAAQRVLIGEDTQIVDAEIEALEAERTEPVETTGPVSFAYHEALKMLNLLMTTSMEGAIIGSQTAIVGAGVGSVVPAIGTTAGFFTGGAIGFRAGAAKAIFDVEGGNAYLELRRIRDENDLPLDPRIAALTSMAIGTVNAGLEYIGASTLLKIFPGGEKVLGRLTTDVAKRALQNPSVRAQLTRILGRYGRGVSTEAITEMAQEAVQILFTEGAKDIAEVVDDTKFRDVETVDAVNRILESGKAGFGAAAFLGLGGVVSSLPTVKRDAEAAQEFNQKITEVSDLVEKTDTKQLNPDHMERYLDIVGLGDEIFITPEAQEALFQTDDEKESILEKLGIDPEEARAQLESGQTIKVKASSFLSKLDPQEKAAISDHIKAAPGAMSKAEADSIDEKADTAGLAASAEELVSREKEYRAELVRYRKEISAVEGPEFAGNTIEVVNAFANRMGLEGLDKLEFARKLRIENLQHIRKFVSGELAVEGEEEFTQTGDRDIKTENFQRFFEGSKVVDEKGAPLVVYHGTNTAFSEFKLDDEGAFFTTSQDIANQYAELSDTGQKRVIPVYLNIKNPFTLSVKEWLNNETDEGLSLDEVFQSLKYDGILVKGELNHEDPLWRADVYVAISDSTQIKSVFNRGTFDPTDPNILRQTENYPATWDPKVVRSLNTSRKKLREGKIKQGSPAHKRLVKKQGAPLRGHTIRHKEGTRFSVGSKLLYGPISESDTKKTVTKQTAIGPLTVTEYFDEFGNKIVPGIIFSEDPVIRAKQIDDIVTKNKEATGWYDDWNKFMRSFDKKGITEGEITKYIKIQAILSAGKGPQGNQLEFAKTIDILEQGEELVSGAKAEGGSGVSGDAVKKIMEIWRGEDKYETIDDRQARYGRKIGAYMTAGLSPQHGNAVVLDRHMPRPWGYNVTWGPNMFEGGNSFRIQPAVEAEIVDDIVEAAARNNVSVAGVQAAIWFDVRLPDVEASSYQGAARLGPPYSPKSMREKVYVEPQNIVHYSKATREFIKGSGLREVHNPWSERDIGNRKWKDTEAWPYAPLGQFYSTSARPESGPGAGKPHITRIEPSTVYDSETDLFGYWKQAFEIAAKDPKNDAVNIVAKLIKDAGFKGFSHRVGNGETWFALFGETPVEQISKQATLRLSDVTEFTEELPQNLSSLREIMQQRSPALITEIKEALRKNYPDVSVLRAEPTMAKFKGATSDQVEYGAGFRLSGPLDSIRAAVSDQVGVSKSQRVIFMETNPEESGQEALGAVVRFRIREGITAELLEEGLAKHGLEEFNIPETAAGFFFDQFLFGDSSESLRNDIASFFEEYGAGQIEHYDSASETIGFNEFENPDVEGEDQLRLAEENYKSHIVKHFGETKGEEVYGGAKARGEIHYRSGQNRNEGFNRIPGELGVQEGKTPRDEGDGISRDEEIPLGQGEEGVIRGEVPLTNESHLIRLYKDKNLTTIIHETGHIFLKELNAVVEANTASPRMQKDMQTVLDWLGADSFADITTEQHEKFADGFVDYLEEGIAPSRELRTAFARFKRWLTQIYRAAVEDRTSLTPEVRAVFGRLLAAKSDIVATAEEHDITPWDKDLLDALGVTADDRLFMDRLYKDALVAAEDELLWDRNRKSKSRQKKWKEEVQDELNTDPTQVALISIQQNKLDSAIVKEQVSEPMFRNLEAKGLLKENGEDLDNATAVFGYSSTSDMLIDLVGANTRAKQSEILLANKQAAYDATFSADDYIASTKEYEQLMQIRARYLKNAAGQGTQATPQKTIKVNAERIFDTMRVGDAARTDLFLGAIKRHSREEKQAIQKKDFSRASEHNELMRLNHEFTKLAIKLRKNREAVVWKSRKILTKDKSKTLRDFRNALYDLIGRFELVGPNSLERAQIDFPYSLENLLEGVGEGSAEEVRQGFIASQTLLNTAVPMRDLAVGQFNELQDLMKYLEIHGRPSKEQKMRDGRKVDEVQREMAAESDDLPQREEGSQVGTDARYISDVWDGFWARSDSLNFIMTNMGGFQSTKKDGQFSITEIETTQALSNAHNEKFENVQAFTDKLMPHYTQILNSMLKLKDKNGKFLSDGMPPTPAVLAADGTRQWTPQMIFALALNFGNESNRARIFTGFPDFTNAQLLQLFTILTQEDWNAIQGIWDLNDEIFKEVDAVHNRVNGYKIKQIPADGFTTQHGVLMRGGYMPVRYDSALMHRVTGQGADRLGGFQEKEDLLARHESKFMTPHVNSKFTKARVSKTPYPLLLSLESVGDHIMDALHYVAYEEVIRDVNRIYKSEDFRGSVIGTLGEKVMTNLLEQLAYIANPRKQSFDPQMEGVMGKLRAGTTAWMLGYNLSVAAKQGLSSTAAAQFIGKRGLINAYAGIGLNAPKWGQNTTFMFANSPYMRSRMSSFNQEFKRLFEHLDFGGVLTPSELTDMRTLVKTVLSPTGKSVKIGKKVISWDDVVGLGFLPIQAVDLATVMPLWTEAYRQRMKLNNDVKESVDWADNMIRSTQPSAQSIDMTKWQRASGAATMLAMFSTFTIGKYQQRVRLNWRMMRAGKISKAGYAQTVLLEQIGPAVAAQLMVAAMRGDDLDDEDNRTQLYIKTVGQLLAMPIPVIGTIIFPLGTFMFDLPVLTPIRAVQRAGQKAIKHTLDHDWAEAAKNYALSFGHAWSLANRVPVTRVIQKVERATEE